MKERIEVVVNENQMVDVLKTVDNGTFINVTMLTDVRMNKTNNPFFGRVKKLSSCNYLTGVNYEGRVKTNMEKEGLNPDSFQVEKPSGKSHVSPCVLVDDKTGGTFYLMVERFDEIQPKVEFLMDGDVIGKELFESYMVKVSESKKQEQDRKVMVLTPKVENIVSFTLNGTKYVRG
jgi:hypothetical protein